MWRTFSTHIATSLRNLIYRPLGGKSRRNISIPLMFACNCVFHYWGTWVPCGEWRVYEWNCGFAILLAATWGQIELEKVLPSKIKESMGFKIFLYIMLHISVSCAMCFFEIHGAAWFRKELMDAGLFQD